MSESGATEEVDALPVLADELAAVMRQPADEPALMRQRFSRTLAPRSAVPAVQTVAVAAGGFVAGAAVLSLVHRRRHPRALSRARTGRIGRSSRAVGETLQIVGSRSLLVDVHLLGGSGDNR